MHIDNLIFEGPEFTVANRLMQIELADNQSILLENSQVSKIHGLPDEFIINITGEAINFTISNTLFFDIRT